MQKLKLIFIYTFFSLMVSTYLYSESNTFSCSIEPFFNIRKGMLDEYVFRHSDVTKKDEKLSELNWPLEYLFYAGGKIKIEHKYFSFDIYGLGCLSKDSGTMIDNDWMNLDDTQTNISFSENKLNNAYIIGADFGIKLFNINFFSMYLNIHAIYDYYDFSAKNGYGWYGDKNNINVSYLSDEATFYKKGTLLGIDFQLNQFTLFTGLNANVKFSRYSLDFGFLISPFTYIDLIDCHYGSTQNVYFYDQMKNSWVSYNFSTSINIYIMKNLEAKLKLSYTTLDLIKGLNYNSSSKKTPESFYLTVSHPGEGSKYLDLSISFIWKLPQGGFAQK